MENVTKAPPPVSPFGWEVINDLSSVTGDDEAVIDYLMHRLGRQEIYTWVGPLLLALNPGKQILRDFYDEAEKRTFSGDASTVSRKPANPHIYAVANHARYRLVNTVGKICQVIVISGESGTGKTFNARKALDFLATTWTDDKISSRPCKILHKISNVSPLISAFSTAKTERNSTSSRHGQLVRLQYDENGMVSGASVHSFLLERTRVTAGTDNFAIFYQIIAGLPDWELNELRLSRDGRYDMLGDFNNCSNYARRCYGQGFRETLGAFEALGFTEECKMDIFCVIALLIHMGDIRFKKKSEEGCTVDFEDEGSRRGMKNACSIVSLPEDELAELLTTTLISPQSLGRRHSNYRRDLKTIEDCRNRLFSVIRYLYERLFHGLVDRVNESLSAVDRCHNWLGILDIFGFESFELNGLEQLCINYTTERLQLYFMEDYLEAGQRELREEGLFDAVGDSSSASSALAINVYRNRLSVIEGTVFPIFNDACQSPVPPNASTLRQQFFVGRRKDMDNFVKINSGDSFIIEHYSCPVAYDVNNLLSKNTDKVPSELSMMFGKCNNKLLRALSEVQDDVENVYRSDDGRAPVKKSTALAKLKWSLDSLVRELNKCDAHYVRCVRPRRANCELAKNEFRKELACAGIFDALPLARCKFPIRFPYDEFYKRYSIKHTESDFQLIRCLSSILNSKDPTCSFHPGKRFIFLTKPIFFELEHFRKNLRHRCAKKIQFFWMKYRRRGVEVRRDSTSESCPNFAVKERFEHQVRGNGCPVVITITTPPDEDLGQDNDELVLNRCQLSGQETTEYYSQNQKEMYTSFQTNPLDRIWKSSIVEAPKKFLEKFQGRVALDENSTFVFNNDDYNSYNGCSIFYRNRILSRRRPSQIPIKFHTRVTCLPHSHRTPYSMNEPRGLEDAVVVVLPNETIEYHRKSAHEKTILSNRRRNM